MTGISIWLGAAIALTVAFALSAILSWCGPVDRPRERGTHSAPTPTSGGLAILAGTAGAACILLFGPRPLNGVAEALGFACGLGLLGAADDVFDFGAKAKLVLQVLLAGALWLWIRPAIVIPIGFGHMIALPYGFALVGLTLWSVVAVNAVNFMDGSNGLVAGAMAIVLIGVGIAYGAFGLGGPLSLLVVFAATAAIGFLPWNFPRARLFQGDAGALFLAGLAAALAPLAAGLPGVNRPSCLYAIPIALLPMLVDVFMTLIARARRGAPLLQAHREHLYQRWLAARRGDHAALAWRFWAITAAFTGAGMATSWRPDWAAAILAGSILVSVAGWLWIDRAVQKAARPSG